VGVVVVPGDTAHVMFRGSWNAAIRSFRRVLELDPTYHLAFQHVQDVLLASVRTGCRVTGDDAPCTANSHLAAVRRVGDSIQTVPLAVPSQQSSVEAEIGAALTDRSMQRNLEEAQRAAREWLQAGPNEARARIVYGRILLRLGRVESADAILRSVTG